MPPPQPWQRLLCLNSTVFDPLCALLFYTKPRTMSGRPHRKRKAPTTISTFSSDSEDLAVDEARGLKRHRLALTPKSHNVQVTSSVEVLYFYITVSDLTV